MNFTSVFGSQPRCMASTHTIKWEPDPNREMPQVLPRKSSTLRMPERAASAPAEMAQQSGDWT